MGTLRSTHLSPTRAVLLLATVAVLAASSARARPPRVLVYFDPLYTVWWTDCQGWGTTSILYVVADNLNTFIRSIEYAVEYPVAVTWLVDFPVPNTINTGETPFGVTTEFTVPGDGRGPLLVMRVIVQWNCDDCYEGWPSSPYLDNLLSVIPHPGTGSLRAVRWEDEVVISVDGGVSLICVELLEPPVPVGETTWGRVKALHK